MTIDKRSMLFGLHGTSIDSAPNMPLALIDALVDLVWVKRSWAGMARALVKAPATAIGHVVSDEQATDVVARFLNSTSAIPSRGRSSLLKGDR